MNQSPPDEDLEDLRALSEDLSKAHSSPWEPQCIARAFLPPQPGELVFTMGQWLELDAIRSPLLVGQDFTSPDELAASAHIFGIATGKLSPENAAEATCAMRVAVGEAFQMALPMKPQGDGEAGARDGFGTWLPIFGFLILDARLSLPEAWSFPVGQAFALLAISKRNQGWKENGIPYATRDALNPTPEEQ